MFKIQDWLCFPCSNLQNAGFYLSRLFRLMYRCADQENQIHDKWDEALFEGLFPALASTFMFVLTGGKVWVRRVLHASLESWVLFGYRDP